VKQHIILKLGLDLTEEQRKILREVVEKVGHEREKILEELKKMLDRGEISRENYDAIVAHVEKGYGIFDVENLDREELIWFIIVVLEKIASDLEKIKSALKVS